MLEDGLSYPTQGESWIGRMLIGGIVIFFSFLIIPVFAFQGYLLSVLRETVSGNETPPQWDDWGELIVDGILASIVGFIYSIIPVSVFLGIGFTMFGLGGAAGDTGGGILAGFGIMFFLLLIPVMFLIYYIVPAALANMAVEDSFSAAFDFERIADVVLSVDYLVAIIMPIVVGFIVNIVTFFLGITIIGYVLVPFVLFYGQVAIFRMFGLAFAAQMEATSTDSSSTATPA